MLMQDLVFSMKFSLCHVQALFLEVNWLKGLVREVMVCKFIWVSKNKEINAITEEHVSL